MRLRSILEDDDAVSPVIGVILMVAITVILAAVIASFVLGLGPSGENQPTASFGFDYNSEGEYLVITHENGDKVEKSSLYVRGSGVDNGLWCNVGDCTASGEIDGESAVASGDITNISSDTSQDVPSDYDVSVVWETDEGSATLSEDSGPDA